MTLSTAVLYSLHVQKRTGDIVMYATKNFFEQCRTKFGAPVGCSLRVGSFDFVQVRKNIYRGVPDERSRQTEAEAAHLCRNILSIFREMMTFELVFPTREAYTVWYNANHRVPTRQDLLELSRQMGIRVPYLNFPYKSPLIDPLKWLRIEPRHEPGTVEFHSQMKVALSGTSTAGLAPPPRTPASDLQLQALAARFRKN